MCCYVFCCGKQNNLGQVSFDYSCSPRYSGLFLLLVLLRCRNNSTSPFPFMKDVENWNKGKLRVERIATRFRLILTRTWTRKYCYQNQGLKVFRGTACWILQNVLCCGFLSMSQTVCRHWSPLIWDVKWDKLTPGCHSFLQRTRDPRLYSLMSFLY